MRHSQAAKMQRRKGNRFAGGKTALSLDDAPVFEPLVRKVVPERRNCERLAVVIVQVFGLTPADIAAGRQAEFERAELRAWSMLRICQWCERRFLPARRNCSCCSRRCYLRWYRKANATAYRDATRRWRAKTC